MASHQARAARLQGRLLGEGLNRIPERYGIPSEEELTLFLAESVLRAEGSHLVLANALARALRHYWAEEYDACVHVIVPRIEAAARLLLLELDATVYRLERGETPGGYVGLGVLLNHLDDFGLDPSWSYFSC